MTKNNYIRGISWFVLSLLVSVLNDVFAKYLGQNLHSVQITFLRFFFGTVSLIPFMLYYGKQSFYTSRITLHVFRAVLLFAAITFWCVGLTKAPITMATTLTFTIPMFVLILARMFLGEQVTKPRWIATLVGFVGVVIVLEPGSMSFSPILLLLIASTIMFAGLDVINKKYVVKESMLAMLFYTALITMIISLVPALYVWSSPTFYQYVLLFLLGCGANLILFCLLKAFRYADASAVAPFRYFELVLSAAFGLFIFGEIPTVTLCLGTLIIIPCTLYLVYSETKGKPIELEDEEEPIKQV